MNRSLHIHILRYPFVKHTILMLEYNILPETTAERKFRIVTLNIGGPVHCFRNTLHAYEYALCSFL